MARTFEEIVAGEMDSLYQGALFLCAGDTAVAESLVVDSVMLAYEEYATSDDPARTRLWFETRLARAFLSAGGRDRAEARARRPMSRRKEPAWTIDPSTLRSLRPEHLFGAAATLPPPARTAIWLVLLRRRTPDAAADAMRVGRVGLMSMLEYREHLLEELAHGHDASRSARGGR